MALKKSTLAFFFVTACLCMFCNDVNAQLFSGQRCRLRAARQSCNPCTNQRPRRLNLCFPPLNCWDPDGFCDCRKRGYSRKECRKYCARGAGCCSYCGCGQVRTLGLCFPPLNCGDPDGFCDCRERGGTREVCKAYCNRKIECPCVTGPVCAPCSCN